MKARRAFRGGLGGMKGERRLLDLLAQRSARIGCLRDFLQRQLAAFVIQFLESVEAVATIAEHFAGLAHVAELLGKLQQATNPAFTPVSRVDVTQLWRDKLSGASLQAANCRI
jgi:hypothetical protein